MKAFTTIMLAMQLLQIAVLSLGPGIFASILFAILFYVFTPACPIDSLGPRKDAYPLASVFLLLQYEINFS